MPPASSNLYRSSNLWQKSCFNGGLRDFAFDYLKTVNAAVESPYPYTARDGTCKSSFTTAIPKGSVTGYIYISGASGLMSAIILQPVSVAEEANQIAFQSYSCSANLDHGILAVGYDSAAGYYLVKNSWGAS